MENKTAVNWLLNKLKKEIGNSIFTVFEEYFYQAIELEKQQIITARVTAPILPVPDKESYIEEAEQYYYETYKNQP